MSTRPIDPHCIRAALDRLGIVLTKPLIRTASIEAIIQADEAITLRHYFQMRRAATILRKEGLCACSICAQTTGRLQVDFPADALVCTDCGSMSDASFLGACPFCGGVDDGEPEPRLEAS